MIRSIKKKISVKILGALVVLVIIGGYSLFETHDLILGPKVSVESPENGLATSSPTILVKGRALRISTIHLNGRQIFTDKEGLFEEQVVLLPGYNILRLDARDKFGRTISNRYQLWRQSTIN